MKKKVLSLAMVAIFLLGPFVIFGQEKSDAPTYKDGDSWLFRVVEKDFGTQSTRALDGDYEVSYKGGKLIVRLAGGENPETRQDLAELRRMLGGEDQRQYLQFPLFVGKKWSADYQAATRAAMGQVTHRNAETSVTGIEDIATPAGTFRAFKIERYDTGARTGGRKGGAGLTRWTYTYYYSPQTQSIVKYYYESEGAKGGSGGKREIELIKFGSAR